MNTGDNDLLRDYAQNGSEEAFEELIRRHILLVYGVGLRQTGNAELAKDVTQLVFTDLARKAKGLCQEKALVGWLYRSARFAASKIVRSEQRRLNRETKAMTTSLLETTPEPLDPEMVALLDDGLMHLGEKERMALLLRFFEQQDLRSIGKALGSNEDAAQKRISRALEKLRKFLLKRGVTASGAAITLALTAQSAQAVPAGLASSVAFASCNAASGSAAVWTMKLLFQSLKLKLGIAFAVIGVAVGLPLVMKKEAQVVAQTAGSEIALPPSEVSNIPLDAQTRSLTELLSNPPNVAECVAEVWKYQFGTTNVTSHVFTLLRRQPNAFLYREMASPAELLSLDLNKELPFYGRYESNYWLYEHSPGLVLRITPDGTKTTASPADNSFTINMSPILNYGIPGARAEWIRFNGNQLQTLTDMGGTKVSGSLKQMASPSALRLDFVLERPERSIPWFVDYTFNAKDKLPKGVPSELKAYVSSPTGTHLQFRIRYLQVLLTKTQLPQTYFDPKKYIRGNIIEVQDTRQGSFYRNPGSSDFLPVGEPPRN